MKYRREIIIHGDAFSSFFDTLKDSVKRKVLYVLLSIRVEEHIPSKFFRSIEGEPGLFEIRIEMESNIYRVFCCFDEGQLVILFNGFQKKTQKTPRAEIQRASELMKDYFKKKNG